MFDVIRLWHISVINGSRICGYLIAARVTLVLLILVLPMLKHTFNTYNTLYNSVPTNDALHATINEGIQTEQLNNMFMTPAICLHVLLSMLFNCMLSHGYNNQKIIISSIIFIREDTHVSG